MKSPYVQSSRMPPPDEMKQMCYVPETGVRRGATVDAAESAAKSFQVARISSAAAELKWRTTWQTDWPASPSTPRLK